MLRAATLPSPEWTQTYEPYWYSLDTAIDPANNLIVSGGESVQRIAPAGNVLWRREINDIAGVTVDAAGTIYATGEAREGVSSTPKDLFVAKISPAGEILWTRSTGLQGATDGGEKIVVDDQGGVYAAGYSTAGSVDIFLVKYDSAGVFQWSRRFNGSADLEDRVSGLVAMPGGGVALTGITRNATEQFVTMRYSASGSALWLAYSDEPDVTEQQPCGIVITSDGALAVSGGSGNNTLATVKYSPEGEQLWVNRTEIGGGSKAQAGNIVALPDGGVAVLGRSYASVYSAVLIRIRGDKTTAWSKLVRTMVVDGYNVREWGLTRLPEGGFLVQTGEKSVFYNQLVLSVVDDDGGSVVDLEWAWQSISHSSTYHSGPIKTGPDGSVWAVNGRAMVRRFGPIPSTGSPVVQAIGVDNLLPTSVRLKGTVNPNGFSASYHYEFGPDAAYGSTTPVRTLSAGTSEVDAFEAGVVVTPGTTYHFRLVASNVIGTSQSADQTFTVPLTAYQTWTVSAFGSLIAPGSGPLDDPDGDGLQNLVEYTFGGNAKESGLVSGTPEYSLWESPESGFTFPSIVYRPDPSRTDVTITPVASNDLMTWTTNGIATTNLPDGSRRAVAQGRQRFMRLQITSP
jgi:hypothetical protein